MVAHFVYFGNYLYFERMSMSESMTLGATTLPTHPRTGMCKELLELFMSRSIGAYCRFVRDGRRFIIEPTTSEKLFSWNLMHGGYFRRFSRDMSIWKYTDYDAFCRQLRSPELYAEICSDNIRIYKHRDFPV